MPYIYPDMRAKIDTAIAYLVDDINRQFPDADVDGVLNYTVSKVVSGVLPVNGADTKYATIARAVAVFECAKLEFYRRVAGPKEDAAIVANGDVEEYEWR